MRTFLKYALIMLFLVSVNAAMGQEIEMADEMRSQGKIYVVVTIVMLVLAGLIGYLFMLDRKVSKLEKSQKKSAH